MKKYYKKYNIISFILAIFIVYRHALNYSEYEALTTNTLTYWFEKFMYSLTGFATMLFALMAGFNLFLSQSENGVVSKLKKRFFTLVIPYIVGITINWLAFVSVQYIPYIRNTLSSSLYNFSFRSFFKTLITGGGTPLWYLRNLIILVYVSPLLYKMINNKISSIMLIFVLMVLWLIQPYDQFSVLYFSIFFLIGSFLARYYPNLITSYKPRKIVKFLLLLGLIVILGCDTIFGISDNERIRVFVVLIEAFLFWLSFSCEKIEKRRYMNLSFGIYVYHYFINEGLNKIFRITFGDSVIGATINFVLSPLITVIIIIAMFNLLNKIMPKMVQIILGGRI